MALIEYQLQTVFAEQVATLSLYRVPHGVEADGTLMSLQQRVDKLRLVARHLGGWLDVEPDRWQVHSTHVKVMLFLQIYKYLQCMCIAIHTQLH